MNRGEMKIDRVLIKTIEQINNDIDKELNRLESAKRIEAERGPPEVDRMSAAGRCYRERWAVFNGLPLDNGKGFRAPILKVFRLGHVIEDEVVDLINSTPGYQVVAQQLEVGRFPFIGHIDGILNWSRNGRMQKQNSLLEIKTAKSARFDLCKKVGYEAWNPGYADQLQAYMYFIDDIEDAVVCVYNKDTSEMHWEQIEKDPNRGEQIWQESMIVTDGSDFPPPRPGKATSQSCKFCKWCDRSEWCWNPATDAKFDP
jgi:hypothetical protein